MTFVTLITHLTIGNNKPLGLCKSLHLGLDLGSGLRSDLGSDLGSDLSTRKLKKFNILVESKYKRITLEETVQGGKLLQPKVDEN